MQVLFEVINLPKIISENVLSSHNKEFSSCVNLEEREGSIFAIVNSLSAPWRTIFGPRHAPRHDLLEFSGHLLSKT